MLERDFSELAALDLAYLAPLPVAAHPSKKALFSHFAPYVRPCDDAHASCLN